MKKIKLLTSLVGLTGLSMGLVPTITGCSCNKGGDTPTPTPTKKADFTTCEWSEINTWCTNLENGTITAEKFYGHFKTSEKSSFTSMDDFVGLTRTIKVNGQDHIIRVIGVNHDELTTQPTGKTGVKAALTFEFANLISDANGYSIATYWNDTDNTSNANYDYLNSSIRKAIDGQGTGTANWFEKDSKTFSTTYTGSVLDMLPANIISNLKTVNKIVNINPSGTWTETSYSTNLFLATPKEMGMGSESGVTTYDYYVGSTSVIDAKRIKAQVQGSTGARESPLSGKDLDGAYTAGKKYSVAGYNSSTSGQGGRCWLASPATNFSDRAWGCLDDGSLNRNSVYSYAFGIAPCFCI